MTEPPAFSLPDPSTSRALLIGVSQYTNDKALGQRLWPLPAVLNNVEDVYRVFTGEQGWGLPEQNVTRLVNPSDPREILKAVRAAALSSTDTLLIYYAGHGLLDDGAGKDLYLSVTTTDTTTVDGTAAPYRWVSEAIRRGKPRRCLVILDCCYSGLAHNTMSSGVLTAGITTTSNTCVLTATQENDLAKAEPGARNTEFTGELVKTLENGIPGGTEFIDAKALYREIKIALARRGQPEPQMSERGDAGEALVLAHNRAWAPTSGTTSSAARADWAADAIALLSSQQLSHMEENAGRHNPSSSGPEQPLLRITYPGDNPPEALRIRITFPAGQFTEVLLTKAHWAAATQPDLITGKPTPLPEVVASLMEKGFRRDPVDWSPHTIGNGHPPTDSEIKKTLAGYKWTTSRDNRVREYLDHGQNVLLVGKSSSGKTTLATYHAEAQRNRGVGLIWLNLTDPFDGAQSVLVTLLTSPERTRHLLVIDNVQSHLAAANDAIRLVNWLRGEFGMQIAVLATTRLGTESGVTQTVPRLQRLAINGDEVVKALIQDHEVAPEDVQLVRRRARDDIFMAKEVLAYYRGNQTVPSHETIADRLAENFQVHQIGDAKTRELLFWFACLGILEIDIPQIHVLSRPDSADAVDSLIRHQLIEASDEAYTIGHRTRALMLFSYAQRHWADDPQTRLGNPGQMIHEYLQEAGQEHINLALDAVKRLDGSQVDTVSLAELWTRYVRLAERVDHQARLDPYWGGNATSAVCGAIVLSAMASLEAKNRAAKQVWETWDIANPDGIPTYRGSRAVDAEIFLAAAPATAAAAAAAAGASSARWHAVWMLSLLLRMESLNQDLDHLDRLECLVAMAVEGRGRSGSGAYRPDWLPWVTAMMVIGLSDTSDTTVQAATRQACDWLVRPPADRGPYLDGHWSGTAGTWISDVVTTAVCVMALEAENARTPRYDNVLRKSYEYLEAWLRDAPDPAPAGELATVISALLRRGHDWRKLYPRMIELPRRIDGYLSLEEGRMVGEQQPQSADPSFEMLFAAAALAVPVQTIVYAGLKHIIEEEVGSMLGTQNGDTDRTAAAVHRPPKPARPPKRANTQPSGPENGVSAAVQRTPPEMASVIAQRLAEMDGVIAEMVSQRQGVLRMVDERTARTIQAELDRWRSRAKKCAALAEELEIEGSLSRESVAELNLLGNEIYPHSWHPVRFDGAA